MSLKLLSCLFMLTLAAMSCKGDSRNYFRNPKYRVLYYRSQPFDGLSKPDVVPATIPNAEHLEVKDHDDDENANTEDEILGKKKGLSEDIYSFIPGSGKIKNDPNDLRPILYSMGRQLRQLVRSHNQAEVTNKNILSVLEDTLAWAKTQAASFYSLISTFQSRSLKKFSFTNPILS